ncbi:hypothetical protein [Dyella sp. A6]|uniref:hypothetical protein n=1 Tax=Dyella aluminiiresistens TaxID=3069105 RepID=UPI002E790F13|nr:hypothetical protein [Dyella sp. A6]
MRIWRPVHVLLLLLGLVAWPAVAGTPATAPDAELLSIAHQWAHITYQLPRNQRDAAYAALESRTAALIRQYPQRARPKVWLAIILSTHATMHGGLDGLSMAKRARDLLLQAQQIDPATMHGAIYTTLGTLYDRVPGWPLGFGNETRARVMLQRGLRIDPNGIDANYFYGDFLYRNGDKAAALAALNKALAAPPRPDRPLADQGRRKQVQALIRTIIDSH